MTSEKNNIPLFVKTKTLINKYFNNPLTAFLIKGFLFFIVWDLLIFAYAVSPSMHQWMIFRLLDASSLLLRWGFHMVSTSGTELYINGIHCVHIGIPCDGIEVMGVFACIVLAYQASWYHKAWMVPLGCLLVFVLNTLRIVILSGLLYHRQLRAFDINHKYVFNIILYGILLILFSIWSSKFGIKHKSAH
jgi:exosortase/archaeosortase family protein